MGWRKFLRSSDCRYLVAAIPVMVLLQALGAEHFRYQRDWLESGEIWRFVSAHWVHVGWMHLFLNSLALVICVSLTMPGWSAARWLGQSLCLGLGISVLVDLYNPEIADYAGHSGILYGLYLLGGISLYARDRLVAVLIVGAIVAKVLMEQFSFYDFNTGALIGARVIVDAHLYGLLTAIAIALAWSAYTMNQRTTRRSN